MADGRHLGFCYWSKNDVTARCGQSTSTTVPNLVTISQMAAGLLRFLFFKMATGRHLGFCYSPKMTSGHAAGCQWLPTYQIWWRYVKYWLSYGDLPFSRFNTGQKWHYGTLRTVNVYHRAKFCNCMSTGSWVILFCGKIQNGGVCHPRSSFTDLKPHIKFGVNRTFYFSRYRDFKILKIWLRTPIQAHKIYVFGGFNP